ncbi:hypothetical protein MUP37_04440, partial [Candidatus Bathyarchaeota archaeon]|nr:hypothetical protein [Candidatus Bathyarchaeota archaeon]
MSTLAYTPGLKRKLFYKVVKERRLPVEGESLVKIGDEVSYDTIVARAYIPGEPVEVSVATELGCESSLVPKYLLKKVGDELKKGDIIAKKPGFFGTHWGEKFCYSSIDGILEYLSDVEYFDEEVGHNIRYSSGRVLIRIPNVAIEVDAYVPGKVVRSIGKEGVAIECPGAFIQGIIGVGGETHGELIVISKSPKDPLYADSMGEECKGKILVGGSKVDADALRKAVQVGARGIIVGGIEVNVLSDFIGYRIGVAITGNEQIGLTLIMTEGFGGMNMAENTFKLLKNFEGKMACLNGATQIRAGVQRPEIIIPYDAEDRGPKQAEDQSLLSGMRIGLPIRIIREPYFGALGHIASLPPELRRLRSESFVRVLEVDLEDGRKVVVPR